MKTQFLTMAFCLLASNVLAQDVVEATAPAKAKSRVPEVLLSAHHAPMVTAAVGDAFPNVALPTPDQGGDPTPLANRLGSEATVVAVMNSDRAMARALLRDLSLDINEKYNPPQGEIAEPKVSVIAIAGDMSPEAAMDVATRADYQLLLLLDPDGEALASLGSGRMPRVYVLNGEGQIEWLDIEYSLSTRREMRQAVRAVAGRPPAQ